MSVSVQGGCVHGAWCFEKHFRSLERSAAALLARQLTSQMDSWPKY